MGIICKDIEKYEDLAILVNSCDKHSDTWDPFFALLKIQWPNLNAGGVFLNTETKDYRCNYLDVETVFTGKNLQWTERMKIALDRISQDYILFMLDDFFIVDTVREQLFHDVFEDFKANPNIGYVFFEPNNQYTTKKKVGKYFYELPSLCSWRVNAGMSLWRKNYLYKMLFQPTDPWSFEARSGRLSLYLKQKAVVLPMSDLPIPYHTDPRYGVGITAGKWLKGNQTLFEKYGIKVNFDRLGIFDEDITYNEVFAYFRNNNSEKKDPWIKKVLRKLPIVGNVKVKKVIRMMFAFKERKEFRKYCNDIDRVYQ